MHRLPRDPRNFRELVEADLRRAARLIIKIQDEIDPQFRIATPEGDYCLAITFPPGTDGRMEIFDKLALWMASKQALAFTFASELISPDSVYCAGIGLKERYGCIARITPEPRPWTAENFGAVEWLAASSIDPVIAGLLPKGAREISARDLEALEVWFGAMGEFPAVKLETGEIGL
ncbi:MAG: hypothetical protein WBX25_01345 [Rhodomicrobium sp.]